MTQKGLRRCCPAVMWAVLDTNYTTETSHSVTVLCFFTFSLRPSLSPSLSLECWLRSSVSPDTAGFRAAASFISDSFIYHFAGPRLRRRSSEMIADRNILCYLGVFALSWFGLCEAKLIILDQREQMYSPHSFRFTHFIIFFLQCSLRGSGT